jgi:hypothetical protein
LRASGGALHGLSDPYSIHEDPAGSVYDVIHQGDLLALRLREPVALDSDDEAAA